MAIVGRASWLKKNYIRAAALLSTS
ncbi:hypothetical protein CCACVL1_02731 [Corchorus capsularis]|uniref:Uncharacterized protein n=1 Tax=Corchorus capsularis TaxID=210143 RepID=A0A1R3K6G1_COCAP|nr:hypothetical protein CCACVL1_02731 [Corchorus capsularis]